ncbi:MAG TPA: hypothetical protein PL037_01255, partial [Elusimicrobiales bacterium]|nr:hypothetical protein [Elusimicrobiales bacterium]
MRQEQGTRAFWKNALTAAVLIALPAAALILSSDKLHYPSAQWDGWALDAARAIRSGTFAADPYVIHPPLYLYLLAMFQPLFGGGPLEQARLLNFVCYLVTGWLVFHLSGRLAEEGRRLRAALAGAALYFTSPLAVQGIFLLDLGDTGPVPAAAAAYFCLLYSGGGSFRTAAVSAAFALNLWAKLIHSLFLVLASPAAALTDGAGARGRYRRGLAALAAGTIVFALTWAVYARYALPVPDRLGPFRYLVEEMLLNYQRQDLSAGAGAFLYGKAVAVLRVLLWLWPLLLLWAWRAFRKGMGSGPERVMNFFILIFLAGAWASKGTSNGFPKYHAAILPALCALCGAYAAEVSDALWSGPAARRRLAAAAAAAFCLFLAGDPIYTFNHGFRETLISGGGTGGAALKLALQAAAVPALVMGLLVFLFGRRGMGPASALAAYVFVWQAAMLGVQARAAYFTTYGYGTSGKAEAVRYVSGRFTGGTVSGPNEFAWDMRAAGVPFLEIGDGCFIKMGCAMEVLRAGDSRFFIFGPASNTVDQVKAFLALTPADLGRPFSSVRKGDF